MPKSVTASTAVIGTRYRTPANVLVTFKGPTPTRNGNAAPLYTVFNHDTNREVTSMPGTQVLFEVDEAAEQAKETVSKLAGKPRDILEPEIAKLSLDELDALSTLDTRAWVQNAIIVAMEAQRVTGTPPIVIPAAPVAPVIAEAPRPIAIVPEAAPWEEAVTPAIVEPIAPSITEPAPIVIAEEQREITEEAIAHETVIDPGARSREYMEGRAAFGAGAPKHDNPYVPMDGPAGRSWARGYQEAAVLAASEPGFVREVVPVAPGVLAIMAAPTAVDARALAEPQPEQPRIAPGETLVAVHPEKPKRAPGKARAAKAPAAPAETSPPHVSPEPILILPEEGADPLAWLQRALAMIVENTGSIEACERLIAETLAVRPILAPHLADVLREITRAAELGAAPAWTMLARNIRAAIGVLRAEVPDTLAATIATAEAEAAEVREATRRIATEGEVAASARAEADQLAGVPPEVTKLAEGRRAAVDGMDDIAHWLDERLDYTPETRARFEALTGTVRQHAQAITGLTPADVPLLDAALEWERAHANRDTITRKLDDKLVRLREGRTRHVEPRTPREARPAYAPGPLPPGATHAPAALPVAPAAPALAPADLARATDVQAALAELAAAVPGYLIAMRAVERVNALGIPVTLEQLAGVRS